MPGVFSDWIRRKLKARGYWTVDSPSTPEFHLQGQIEAADLVMLYQAMRQTLEAYRLDGGYLPADLHAEVRKYRPPKSWREQAVYTKPLPPPLPPPDPPDEADVTSPLRLVADPLARDDDD